jgi:hypothetical protein
VKADGVVQVEAGTLWTVHFADRGTTRRWATFPVSFWQHDVADDRNIRRHFRGELRKKARVCPICCTLVNDRRSMRWAAPAAATGCMIRQSARDACQGYNPIATAASFLGSTLAS